MSTTLRHGLSLELVQSLRCLETKDTVMAMEEYIKYLDANVNTVDPGRVTMKEIVQILKKTVDDMEHARIFPGFKGK